jgi:cephalosporin hydroxylase
MHNFFLSFFLFLSITTTVTASPADLKRKVLDVLPSLEGWCSSQKAENLIDLVLEVRPNLCVEIGVFGGASLFPVASALKFLQNGVAIGIDPWDKFEAIRAFDPVEEATDLNWWGNLNFQYIYYSYVNMIARNRLENYIITLKTTSEHAAQEIIDPIDILFVDGNHNSLITLRDVELYLPKVRIGGYVWLNNLLDPRKHAARDLILKSCEEIKSIDQGSCVLYKKK